MGSNYGLTALTSTRISSMWRDNLVSPLVSWNLDINPLKPTVGYLMCWVALLKRGWSHLLFVDDPIVICGWSNCYLRRIPLLFTDDPICYSWMIPFVICGWSYLLFLDDPICYSWMIPFVIHGWSHLLFMDDNNNNNILYLSTSSINEQTIIYNEWKLALTRIVSG